MAKPKTKEADSKAAKLKAEEHADKTSDAAKAGTKAPARTDLQDAPEPEDRRLAATEGVVARGRTVVTEKGTFRPGQKVTASKDEITRLRKNGSLVDPARASILLGAGPRFFQEDAAAKGAKEA